MKLKDLINNITESAEYEMSESKIRQAMAESGKSTVKQLMDYMKAKYPGQYDINVARANAKELVADMK